MSARILRLPCLRHLGFAWISIFSAGLTAGEVEVELNGFRLQQIVKVAEHVMGPADNTIDGGDTVANVFWIDDEAYMVVEHFKNEPNHISMLQLTGKTTKAAPFKGLRLGDPESRVLETLGKPDSLKLIESSRLTMWSYEERNYTVELDEQGLLHSIQIFTNEDVVNPTVPGAEVWAPFEAAVKAKDFDAVANLLRPDVEIYRSGKILWIRNQFAEFVKQPDDEFLSALFGDTDSVRVGIADTKPDEQIRVVQDFGVGRVFKFPADHILREIVFFPYAGTFRVYEIAFREPAAP